MPKYLCYYWVSSFFCINFICTIYEFESHSLRGVLDATSCDKLYQRIVVGRWFFPGTAVSSTNKADRHDIATILLKVALNTITLTPHLYVENDNSSRYCFISILMYNTYIFINHSKWKLGCMGSMESMSHDVW